MTATKVQSCTGDAHRAKWDDFHRFESGPLQDGYANQLWSRRRREYQHLNVDFRTISLAPRLSTAQANEPNRVRMEMRHFDQVKGPVSELEDVAMMLRRFTPNLAGPKPCTGCQSRIEACRLCPHGDVHWELRLPMDQDPVGPRCSQRPLGMLQVPSERNRPADRQGPTT